MRTGIVLAGGRSARFRGQKLAADVDGISILAATISAFAGLVDGLIVAGPQLPPDWGRVWDDATPLMLIPDADPFGGPLAALANVLGRATPGPDTLTIVVGGDMPALVPGVLRAMFDRLDADPSIDALVLEAPDRASESSAPLQVLPLAVREARGRAAVLDAVGEGRRSLRSLLDRLRWEELPAAAWSPLDPDGRTLLDVDTRADLERIRPG